MSEATGRQPVLRCRSCGYDIASLVEQRGREEPGVCPECGADLHESLVERPGTPVQRGGRFLDYLRFLWLATVRPRTLVNSMQLGADNTGGVMYGNCVGAGVTTFLTSCAVGGAFALFYSDPSLLVYAFQTGAVVGVFAIMGGLLLLPVFAVLGVALGWITGARVGGRVSAALDVGTVWMVWWPLLWALWFGVATGLSWINETLGVLSAIVGLAMPPLLVIVRTVSTLHALRSAEIAPPIDPSASKRPSPSNLT